jgi:hypothetical protein
MDPAKTRLTKLLATGREQARMTGRTHWAIKLQHAKEL